MREYPWAANEFKLQRAIAAVGREEEAVKAEYIKLGGLLIRDSEPTVAVTVDLPPTTTASTGLGKEVSQEKKKAAKKK